MEAQSAGISVEVAAMLIAHDKTYDQWQAEVTAQRKASRRLRRRLVSTVKHQAIIHWLDTSPTAAFPVNYLCGKGIQTYHFTNIVDLVTCTICLDAMERSRKLKEETQMAIQLQKPKVALAMPKTAAPQAAPTKVAKTPKAEQPQKPAVPLTKRAFLATLQGQRVLFNADSAEADLVVPEEMGATEFANGQGYALIPRAAATQEARTAYEKAWRAEHTPAKPEKPAKAPKAAKAA